MKQPSNLRFLLSLGNQKVIVMDKGEEMQLYANEPKKKQQVSPQRIATVLDSR